MRHKFRDLACFIVDQYQFFEGDYLQLPREDRKLVDLATWEALLFLMVLAVYQFPSFELSGLVLLFLAIAIASAVVGAAILLPPITFALARRALGIKSDDLHLGEGS